MAQIAIGLPYFRMRATADWPIRMNEVTISTIAIDSAGLQAESPAVQINTIELVNPVRAWERVDFAGPGGRLVYGPSDPGEFVYVAAIYIEKDDKSRDLGAALEDAVKSEEVKSLTKALGAIPNPTVQIVTGLIDPVTKLIARILKGNKDDLLFTHQGTFFKNTAPPFNMGDTFTAQNKYIESAITIVPLIQHDGLESMDDAPELELSLLAGKPRRIVLE